MNNIPFRQAFATKITQLRKGKELTQKELAEAIDIPRSSYAAFEEGRMEPPAGILKKIAAFHGKSLDDLVNVG